MTRAPRAMTRMSSGEWSVYPRVELGVAEEAETINREVVPRRVSGGRLPAGVDPRRSVAIEDSSNGIRAAVAAEMALIAVPNPHYPPDEDALNLAQATQVTLEELTPALVRSLA